VLPTIDTTPMEDRSTQSIAPDDVRPKGFSVAGDAQ
jgi:hypothetical protein